MASADDINTILERLKELENELNADTVDSIFLVYRTTEGFTKATVGGNDMEGLLGAVERRKIKLAIECNEG
jgi:hypothetical protein